MMAQIQQEDKLNLGAKKICDVAVYIHIVYVFCCIKQWLYRLQWGQGPWVRCNYAACIYVQHGSYHIKQYNTVYSIKGGQVIAVCKAAPVFMDYPGFRDSLFYCTDICLVRFKLQNGRIFCKPKCIAHVYIHIQRHAFITHHCGFIIITLYYNRHLQKHTTGKESV